MVRSPGRVYSGGQSARLSLCDEGRRLADCFISQAPAYYSADVLLWYEYPNLVKKFLGNATKFFMTVGKAHSTRLTLWEYYHYLRRMSTHDDLLAKIEAFLKRTDMKASTFGRRAVDDGKLVPYLREGRSITIRRMDQILAFMAEWEKKTSEKAA